MATPPTPAPAEEARLGTFGRLIGALVDPRATFEDIARKPGWVVPVVLYCLLGVAITVIFTQRVGWESFLRKRFERSSNWSQLTAEQQQTQIERASKFAPITGSIGVVMVYVVGTLIVSGILLGAMRIVHSAEVDYKASLGIVAHAYMPGAVSQLLAIVILFLKEPSAVDIQNLVGSNVGAFLSEDAPRWLQTLGSSLDLFSFWIIFLLATGFAAASPKKLTTGKALWTILPLWAIYVLARAGLAAAFS